jgi:CDP-glucose 4,6-dehydratase
LVPDFLRAIDAGQELVIRSPLATRPWQHVLEPVSGYLRLAQRLCEDGQVFDGAWNFGPPIQDAKPVRWIVERLCKGVPGASWRVDAAPQPHEAHILSLDNAKACERLGWKPRWSIDEALTRTLEWHLAWRKGSSMQATCLAQLRAYEATA